MNKLTTFYAASILIFLLNYIPQKKENKNTGNNPEQEVEIGNPGQSVNDTIRKCATMEVFEKHLSRAPSLQSRIDGIEKRCQVFINAMRSGKGIQLDLIYIPVVVHVIHNKKKENISDAQIQSQIDVLNEDFNKVNTDIDKIPKEFSGLASDIKLRFQLDRVIRIRSTRTSWGTNDQMKFSSNGGSNAIDPRRNLNIWVCNILALKVLHKLLLTKAEQQLMK